MLLVNTYIYLYNVGEVLSYILYLIMQEEAMILFIVSSVQGNNIFNCIMCFWCIDSINLFYTFPIGKLKVNKEY